MKGKAQRPATAFFASCHRKFAHGERRGVRCTAGSNRGSLSRCRRCCHQGKDLTERHTDDQGKQTRGSNGGTGRNEAERVHVTHLRVEANVRQCVHRLGMVYHCVERTQWDHLRSWEYIGDSIASIKESDERSGWTRRKKKKKNQAGGWQPPLPIRASEVRACGIRTR